MERIILLSVYCFKKSEQMSFIIVAYIHTHYHKEGNVFTVEFGVWLFEVFFLFIVALSSFCSHSTPMSSI